MPEYIMLFRFTPKGAENIKDSPNRLKNARKIFEDSGAKIKSFHAVLGKYDTVVYAEAPDDETIAKLSLKVSSLGNVRGETLRAFNEETFGKIVKDLS